LLRQRNKLRAEYLSSILFAQTHTELGIMADKSDSESEKSGEEEKTKDQKFVAKGLESAQKWGAKGIEVDKDALLGRRANRGFTVAMGKTGGSSDIKVDVEELRRGKRAQTLPATSTRRGDFMLSGDSQKALAERQEFLKARFRRGSVGVVFTVVPPQEFKSTWEAEATLHVYGSMTEGQAAADERERNFTVGDKDHWPSALPPVIACTKGSKGFRDTTPNQDNFSLTYLKNGWTICCVMDGHGPFGHYVSTRTVQTVPYYLVKCPDFPDGNMKVALVEAFERSQKDVVALAVEEDWDVQASGTTAVCAAWKGNQVWTAHAGDSRIIIASEAKRTMSFETKDHKPTDKEEVDRINASGGEVRSQTYPDGWTVHRIFVKGQDFPGLCMARTLGDASVKDHGVVATPEVCGPISVDMKENPFMILASDGVWEFLDSEFVAKAVAKKIASDGPERTIQKLQRESRKRWRQEEGDYCDDITSVLIQFRA